MKLDVEGKKKKCEKILYSSSFNTTSVPPKVLKGITQLRLNMILTSYVIFFFFEFLFIEI